MPGLIKIGCSTKHPLDRAKQLSSTTAAAMPFIVAYHREVAAPFEVEALIHKLLNEYRVNEGREFFRMPLHEVVKVFDTFPELAGDVATPFAELFATFSDDGEGRELTLDEQELCRRLEYKLNHAG